MPAGFVRRDSAMLRSNLVRSTGPADCGSPRVPACPHNRKADYYYFIAQFENCTCLSTRMRMLSAFRVIHVV